MGERITGSDICIMTNSLTLKTNGVSGFYVETAGHRTMISISQLRGVIYNPNRDSVTFLSVGQNKQPAYSTYDRSRTSFTVINQGKHPAVIAAEKLLRKQP